MRRLLAAIIFGLVLLVAAPAALAAEGDYPPEAASSGVVRHNPAPGPAVDLQLAGEDSLAGTGSDVAGELGVGAGLILLGSTTLLLVRRRRGMARAR